jgi:hypothetical protein
MFSITSLGVTISAVDSSGENLLRNELNKTPSPTLLQIYADHPTTLPISYQKLQISGRATFTIYITVVGTLQEGTPICLHESRIKQSISGPGQRKTKDQRQRLKAEFAKKKRPGTAEVAKIGEEIKLDFLTVKKWFETE